MKKIEIDELKGLQLNILKDIHNFCINNGIEYSLAYGTLLGAIRHKGYIPWDDDIDIMMLRSDYELFLHKFKGYRDYLEICAPEYDLNYYAPYANVWDNRTILVEGNGNISHRSLELGVKIDVFPIDKTSPNKLMKWYTKLLFGLWLYHGIQIYRSDNVARTAMSHIFKIVAHLIGYKNIQRLIKRNATRFANCSTEYLDMLVFYNAGDRKFDIHDFDSFTNVTFEKINFRSIGGYDDYLHCAYGNYMQLPPMEQRTAHHGFTAYWK